MTTAIADHPARYRERPVAGATAPRVKSLVRQALDHPLLSYYLVCAVGAMLLGLGVLMVISSSSVEAAVVYGDPYYIGKHQILFAVVGLLVAVLFSRLRERVIEMLAWPALILGCLLVVLTFTPLGVTVAGNRNWLRIGPTWMQFQPSEFAKVALIVWGAAELAHAGKKLGDLRQWTRYLIGTFAVVGFVVGQQDLGSAVIMAAMIFVIMIAAGAPWRLLAGIIGVGVAGVVGLIVTQPYRMQRILAFLHPSPGGSLNQQADHSLLALASGGWFGQGLGSSRQKWGLLAEAHTDYIFAIIGEELGLVGTLAVIVLFAVLAYAGVRIAWRSVTTFSRLLAIGVVAWFTVQAFVNIGVACVVLPTMGVTLPMISYGGSSLIANLIAMGILAGCARREPEAAKALGSRQRVPMWTSIVRTRR